MTKYWTDLVKQLSPYVPGEQRSGPGIIKLNTNENPYPPSPDVITAIKEVSGDALRRYPDPTAIALRSELARYHHINPQQVFVGNGSDEVLAMAFMAFFTGDKAIQFPDISYSFYPVYCDLLSVASQTIPLTHDFTLDLNLFDADAGGIIFPNPNAPTSCAVSRDHIIALLERTPDCVVLVDEAYADFGADSVIDLIDSYPNLIVSRTFSKGRSMAGLRLGAAFADSNLIEALHRVKDSFNSYPVDAVAQAAGIASLQDEAYYQQTRENIITTRQWTSEQLTQRNYTVLPSTANFIFASPPTDNAGALFSALSDQGVMVRYWPKDPIRNWLRITIGTDTEMQRFISAVDSIP